MNANWNYTCSVYSCVQHSEIWTFQLNLHSFLNVLGIYTKIYTEVISECMGWWCCVFFFSFVKSKFFNIQTKVEWVDQFSNGCMQFSLEIVCYLICTYFDGFVMCWMCTKIKMNLCEICLVLGVCECGAVANSSSVLHFSCWCNNIIPWLKIEWLCPRQEALRPFSIFVSVSLSHSVQKLQHARIYCLMFYATINVV